MRNKKYRPILFWILLIVIIAAGVPLCILVLKDWARILLIVVLSILLIGFIFCLAYSFEIQQDRILITFFKTKTVLFEDIAKIEYKDSDKTIFIKLKNNVSVRFTMLGCLKKKEIVNLIDEVKNQISID